MKDYLGKNVEIVIERPLGTLHDETFYTVNYGYIPETVAEDGEEIDVYLIGVHEPLEAGSFFKCKIIAAVCRKGGETKLVGCPEDKDYSIEQIEALLEFREKRYKHRIIK